MRQAPRVQALDEGKAMPWLEADDGRPAPGYRYLRRVHANERQVTSVISACVDERICKMAPKRFRTELIIPVPMELGQVRIGWARQILTIGTAGVDAATVLKVAASAPVAEVRRVFCDPEGTVIYVGELTDRGDFIRVDMDLLASQRGRQSDRASMSCPAGAGRDNPTCAPPGAAHRQCRRVHQTRRGEAR